MNIFFHLKDWYRIVRKITGETNWDTLKQYKAIHLLKSINIWHSYNEIRHKNYWMLTVSLIHFYCCILWVKPMGGWLRKTTISIKSVDLIAGIIKCGKTCIWTTMAMEINMQMVETSLPVNEQLRHIISAVKIFSTYIEDSSLLSGRQAN